jgi:purine-binding chemotaxis protein CheW
LSSSIRLETIALWNCVLILKEEDATTIAAPSENSPASKPDKRAGKYLTFQLGKEEFGVGVMKVQEIMRMQDVTAVPGTPVYLKGVMNLRGKIIPVIDLRSKFGMPSIEYTQRTCVIVVQLNGTAVPLVMGMIVDEVCEVLIFGYADIEDPPDFGVERRHDILGLAKSGGKVKILLDIDRVLSGQEIHALDAVLQ